MLGKTKLFTARVDNSPLVIFRAFFGLLLACEAWGAVALGWVKKVFVEPDFTFNFIGFEFLQPLPGNGMYFFFSFMGVLGILIMLGYKYRLAIIGYAIMWSCAYLMQKTSYNNHYYLLMLLLWLMAFLPANRSFSLDAKLNPAFRKISMPRWVTIAIILQLAIVYSYASIAKLYPDWLSGKVIEVMMRGKKDFLLIGESLQLRGTHLVIAYVGIFFDGLIIPALLWKKTRKWAFILSIVFHISNAFIFHIGIFPFLSLAFTVFFFPAKTIHQIFLKKWKEFYNDKSEEELRMHTIGKIAFSLYFLIQIMLPVRHHFIPDNVLWTEEGHRLSWRMMLRTKSGYIHFKGVNLDSGKSFRIPHRKYVSEKQARALATKPDMVWQLAQRLKETYEQQGQNIAIYAKGKIRINGRNYAPLIDSNVDLTQEDWSHFKHHNWILPSNDYLKSDPK